MEAAGYRLAAIDTDEGLFGRVQFGKIEPERNLRNLYVFRNEVQTLPPGAELHFNLGVGSQIFGPDVDLTTTPKVLTLTAKYRGEIEYDDRFVIVLNQYLHSTTAGAIPLKQELDRICDQVARVGGMLGDHVTAIKALVEKSDGGQSH